MKKIIYAFLLAIMAVIISVGIVGCGDESNWAGTSIKDWGAVKSINGFVCETENNLYFINGQGSSTSDNEFGVPVKGALIGIKKADFLSGKMDKAEIVVPKLFTSSDYKAGLTVYGDYVYYGTPNTATNSSGDIANNEMVIARTKLDGTDTTELTVLPSNSTEFRVLQKAGKIYVVYYDTEDVALKVYCDGKTSVIAKTDAKTNATGYESLETCKFISGAKGEDIAVVYTTTVYAEKYYSDKAERPGYNRLTEQYNNMYVYSAGESTLVSTGKKDENHTDWSNYDVKFELAFEQNGYLFYNLANTVSGHAHYGVKVSEVKDLEKHVKLNHAAETALANTNLIVSLDEVYTVDVDSDDTASAGKAYKTTLTGNEDLEKRVVIAEAVAKKVLFIDGEFIYYVNSSDQIARSKVSGDDVREERVSESTFSGGWYNPVLVKINGESYVFYCDNTEKGAYYLACINTANTVIEEDADYNGTPDRFYLDGAVYIAEKTLGDKAKEVEVALDSVYEDSKVKFTEEDGVLTFAEYDKAKAILDATSNDVKGAINSDKLNKFKHAGKAIELMKKYYALKDVVNFDSMDDTEKGELRTLFNEAKSARDAVKNSTEYTLQTVIELIDTNCRWYYQEANKLLNA